ncbi:MAG: hypothetical protein IIY21_10940 [Clostridiales bacterium]|nr:hypothetical protein [Clostridiales bacterium]MBQ1571176.1 hypothetical protein [Clostridiales bacterium]
MTVINVNLGTAIIILVIYLMVIMIVSRLKIKAEIDHLRTEILSAVERDAELHQIRKNQAVTRDHLMYLEVMTGYDLDKAMKETTKK